METTISSADVFEQVKTLRSAVNERVENIDSRVSDIQAQMLAPTRRSTHPSTNPETPGARLTKATAFLEAVKTHGRGRFELVQCFTQTDLY